MLILLLLLLLLLLLIKQLSFIYLLSNVTVYVFKPKIYSTNFRNIRGSLHLLLLLLLLVMIKEEEEEEEDAQFLIFLANPSDFNETVPKMNISSSSLSSSSFSLLLSPNINLSTKLLN